jgi:hypothetical protein
MSFKYYEYISDTKVDMLLEQIQQQEPARQRKIAHELKLDLKVLGFRRTTETESTANRFARVEAVTRYLHRYGDVGSVDEPGQFFWGILPMRWGPYAVDHTLTSALVYFGGNSERTHVGLGGSVFHLRGNQRGDELPHSHSATPALLSALGVEQSAKTLARTRETTRLDDASEALAAVHLANTTMRGPAQNLEFLAKRLLYGPSPYPHRDPHPAMSVLLGSPIYVALAD